MLYSLEPAVRFTHEYVMHVLCSQYQWFYWVVMIASCAGTLFVGLRHYITQLTTGHVPSWAGVESWVCSHIYSPLKAQRTLTPRYLCVACNFNVPMTVSAWSKGWTVFARSNTEIVGSNPTQGIYMCVCVYFVFLCVGSGLVTGWSPV
jgi:hypothetical protein